MFVTHKVISNTVLNRKFNLIKLITLNPDLFDFKAGQFVTVRINKDTFRSYSIASSPSTLPYWNIFVDITPGGPGTTYLKALKKGDQIQTSTASGHFVLETKYPKYIFGATGCGIAPFMSIIEDLIKYNDKEIVVIWGLRYHHEIALLSQFKHFSKANNKFSLNIILSKPEKSWRGKSGRITPHLIQSAIQSPHNYPGIYLSGSSEFIQNARNKLLKLKVPPNSIHFESCY